MVRTPLLTSFSKTRSLPLLRFSSIFRSASIHLSFVSYLLCGSQNSGPTFSHIIHVNASAMNVFWFTGPFLLSRNPTNDAAQQDRLIPRSRVQEISASQKKS